MEYIEPRVWAPGKGARPISEEPEVLDLGGRCGVLTIRHGHGLFDDAYIFYGPAAASNAVRYGRWHLDMEEAASSMWDDEPTPEAWAASGEATTRPDGNLRALLPGGPTSPAGAIRPMPHFWRGRGVYPVSQLNVYVDLGGENGVAGIGIREGVNERFLFYGPRTVDNVQRFNEYCRRAYLALVADFRAETGRHPMEFDPDGKQFPPPDFAGILHSWADGGGADTRPGTRR